MPTVNFNMEHLNIAWSGDFGSLKQFFKDVLNFGGEWSQPGGDKKKYSHSVNQVSHGENPRVYYILKGKNQLQLRKFVK